MDQLTVLWSNEHHAATLVVNGQNLADIHSCFGDWVGVTDVHDRWFYEVRDVGEFDERLLLVCNCGCTGCMSLWAKITVEPTMVRWTDLRGERGQSIDAAYTFDRIPYDNALRALRDNP